MRKIILFLTISVVYLVAIELELTGSVVSDNQKMITSRYMGFVKNMKVSEGDVVKKGDPLYEIDSKEIESAQMQVELAISQATLALQMNRAQHANIKQNLARHKRLFVKGMVSKYDLEQLELAAANYTDMVKISQKQVEQAKAKMQEVLNQYRYLRIIAPNDGVIVMKNINEGEIQIPGMPSLVLTDLSNLKIAIEVSESDLGRVRIGKKVDFEIPSIKLQGEGKIASVIPSSNPMTHKFKIKIDFDSHGKFVFPGMYTKVTINE
ncbi:MAG: efflux RND transporter periplasmic adaptor subunit [Sulfurovum sp.]|nr:efflux RND transporter periplasmic adaptor subunit [Sulfurovum sp.]